MYPNTRIVPDDGPIPKTKIEKKSKRTRTPSPSQTRLQIEPHPTKRKDHSLVVRLGSV